MPLNRNFYSLAVFTAALHTAIYLIQGVVYFLIGQQIYTIGLFFPWFLFCNVLFFLGSLIYLNYFRLKKYDVGFWTLLFNTTTNIFPFVVFFGVFIGKRSWISMYMPANQVLLSTTILFGLALIFSNAGERRWLKAAGTFLVVASTALLSASIWYLNATGPDKVATLEQIIKWSSLLSCLAPIMMLMNFLEEQQDLNPEEAPSTQLRSSETAIMAVKPIVMLATLFFAFRFTSEAVAKVSWERNLVHKSRHWETVRGARTFVGSQGDTLKYQLIFPENLDSAKKYPMVVCLPYSAGIEGAPPAKYLLDEANRKKYPAFVFVPFCPNGIGWGGIPNYPTRDTLVFESIEAVEKEFNEIDAKRVYVTGVSRGGYGSWHFISLRPDLFAAAMPVCGGGDPKTAANMIDVAVWAFHGEDDHNVRVNGSRDMIAAMKKSGGNPRYTEFEGQGHDIWNYVTLTPGVFDWLFQQKRE